MSVKHSSSIILLSFLPFPSSVLLNSMCGRGWLILVLILKAYLAVFPIGEYSPRVSDAVDKRGHEDGVLLLRLDVLD